MAKRRTFIGRQEEEGDFDILEDDEGGEVADDDEDEDEEYEDGEFEDDDDE